jgi:hypothetical protein
VQFGAAATLTRFYDRTFPYLWNIDLLLSGSVKDDQNGFRLVQQSYVLQPDRSPYEHYLWVGSRIASLPSADRTEQLVGEVAEQILRHSVPSGFFESVEHHDLRTVIHAGQPHVLWSHLKIGAKQDSDAETFRAHFEWLAGERRILIGHCGPHLDLR